MRQVAWIPVLFLSAAANAQQAAVHESRSLSDALSRMKNGDLHTQKVAFDDLMTRINSEPAG
jgi:hypothetical protein